MFSKVLTYYKNFFSAENYRTLLIKKNIIYSLVLRGLSVAISLILVPMTINYVNTTQYGIWLTLSSVINWFSFFDIGLGNGLKNKLAESNALNKLSDAKIYVSTTYAILSLISIVVFSFFFISAKFINWNSILNISSTQVNNLGLIFLVILGCFCLQFVFQLINVVLTALHAPSKVSLLLLIGQTLSLIAIFFLTKNTKGSLIYLVIILAGIPVLVQLTASAFLYKTKYRSFAPSFSSIDLKYSKGLLTLGGAFFVIQMGQLVLYQSDNIIITNLFGPNDVTTFNISYKLFSVVLIIFTIFINPFWSAFTDAYAKKDMAWIKQIFVKMQKAWLVTALATFLLLACSPIILHLWLKNMVIVPFSLSLVMSLYVIGSCWHMLCCFLLNGINKIKLQLYMYIVCFIINIPLAILLGRYIGLLGIVVSNIICFAAMGLVFYIQCNKILNNSAKGVWNQ